MNRRYKVTEQTAVKLVTLINHSRYQTHVTDMLIVTESRNQPNCAKIQI